MEAAISAPTPGAVVSRKWSNAQPATHETSEAGVTWADNRRPERGLCKSQFSTFGRVIMQTLSQSAPTSYVSRATASYEGREECGATVSADV